MPEYFEEKKERQEKLRVHGDSHSDSDSDSNSNSNSDFHSNSDSDLDGANENDGADKNKGENVAGDTETVVGRSCESRGAQFALASSVGRECGEPIAEVELERPVRSAAPVYRAKPRRFAGYCALFVWTLPLFIALIDLLGDPAAWPYFKAEYLDGATPEAIADYTRALKVRPNMDILLHRARLYGRLDRFDEQVADYRVLLKNNVPGANGEICRALARIIVAREGVTGEVINLLRRAVALSRPGESLFPDTIRSSISLNQANYDLLSCGDGKTIKALSQLQWKDSGLTEDEAAFFRALALRELGSDKECMAELDVIDGDNYVRQDLGYRLYCFKALSALDHSKAKAATGYLAEYSENIAKRRKSLKPNALVNLTTAWLLYSQGKFAEALKATDVVKNIFEDDEGYMHISSYQLEAANHLLRSHILHKLNRAAEAKKELEAYRESGCRGALFVPKAYRDWVGKALDP
jgi:tetratricopeptide (TPR) repeat protein